MFSIQYLLKKEYMMLGCRKETKKHGYDSGYYASQIPPSPSKWQESRTPLENISYI